MADSFDNGSRFHATETLRRPAALHSRIDIPVNRLHARSAMMRLHSALARDNGKLCATADSTSTLALHLERTWEAW